MTSITHSLLCLIACIIACNHVYGYTCSSYSQYDRRIDLHRKVKKSHIVKRNLLADDDRPKLSMQEEDDRPRISIEDETVNKPKKKSISSSYTSSPSVTTTTSVKKTSATFGSLSVEDLKSRMVPTVEGGSMRKWSELPDRKEDLNGINPLVPLVWSALPAAMAYYGWKLSSYLSATFAIQFVDSDIYPVQRFAIVARNIVVGITTLATGFSGVVSVGMFLLGLTVLIGVLKGELDPTPKIEGIDDK